MRIEQIREKVSKNFYDKLTSKQVLCDWLGGSTTNFDVGLTLMPKKVFYKTQSSRKGFKKTEVLRHLTSAELVRASNRFIEILNKLVYKNAYKRYNKRMDVVMIIEGESELIDLHSHFAIAKPISMSTFDFAKLTRQALEMSGDFEIINHNYNEKVDNSNKQYRYKLDLIDSGWLTYITKKLDSKEFRNLYLP